MDVKLMMMMMNDLLGWYLFHDFLLFISLFGSRAKTDEQYKPVFLRPRQVTLISLSDSLAFFLSG